jgi:hypothetical protein
MVIKRVCVCFSHLSVFHRASISDTELGESGSHPKRITTGWNLFGRVSEKAMYLRY